VAAAANFAVMAPGTNIGAAAAVGAGGADLPETLARKIDEDTRAFIRSIAEIRDRNGDALEETVSKAKAYSEQEALDVGIIDLIAPDMDAMLEQLHGRTAETAAGPVVVESAGARVDQLGRTLLEHLLGILANPNLALVLFLIGGVALWAEWSVPGMIGPGVIGVIALILAFVGFFNLPGNWVGLVLLALAMGLFYAETTAPGFSLFGAGGIVSFVLGSIFLFGNFFSPSDLPELNIMVSPVVIAVTSGLMAAAWVLFMRLAMHGGGVSTGFQTEKDVLLEGAAGVAVSDLDPAGRVRVSDKEWSASAGPGDSIREGEEIRVVGVYGEVLKVERPYRQRKG
jgi:membrane-bound serine protease (ClpP class)